MARSPSVAACRGLFITGTDTGVGKTYVASLIAQALRAAGHRVGTYKPVASGCRQERGAVVSDDAIALWEAAGRPGALDEVCPQRFLAPLAPHLAARAEGKKIDAARLRQGIDVWRGRSDVVLVEGAGGLMSPIGDEYVADLAYDFGYPLLIVAADRLGAINHTLQTLIAAASFREGLEVAGIVINHPDRLASDESLSTNRDQIATRAVAPVLTEVGWRQPAFRDQVNWYALAAGTERQ
ncbi:MAG: dethiobiotin synthase [Thermoguttaceae bacterium]|jgi:dethiobiotin synthetase